MVVNVGSGYLADMGAALSLGMVPVWSYWQGNVAWLDAPACSSENPEVTGNYIFSNMIVSGTVVSTTRPPVVPVPSGSYVCGTAGTTTNVNWIEFKAPSGVNGASTTASVKCPSGATFSCTWNSGGVKYQCACSGSPGCPAPFTVTVGGKTCVLSSSLALSDDTAETTVGSDQSLIIGLSVGIAVTVLVIIVLIVVVFIKKKTGNYMETV